MNTRSTAYPVDTLFLERWSPRSLEPTPVPEADLLTMLEAARFAPSAFNMQPWRFVYALRGTPEFDAQLEALDPFNRGWAQHGGALVWLASLSKAPDMEGVERSAPMHVFDAGAAWAQFALQASRLGYAAHAMAGIERPRAAELIGLPEGGEVHIAIAVGKRAPAERLPEGLQAREKPSARQPLDKIAFAGTMA